MAKWIFMDVKKKIMWMQNTIILSKY